MPITKISLCNMGVFSNIQISSAKQWKQLTLYIFYFSSVCSHIRYMLVTRMSQLTGWQRVANPLNAFYLDHGSLSPDWSNWQRTGNSSHNNCLTEKRLSICGYRACEKLKRLKCYQCSIQLLFLFCHVHVFQLSNFFQTQSQYHTQCCHAICCFLPFHTFQEHSKS